MTCFIGLWPVSYMCMARFKCARAVHRCTTRSKVHAQVLNTSSACHVTLVVGAVSFPRNLHYFDVTSSHNFRRNFQWKDAVTDITTAPKMSLPQHSKCNYRTCRDRITHIFTIPLTLTNHVSWLKCNGIEVHIRRVINCVPNFIECNDVFDARVISLKHQYPVEGFAKTIGK